MIYLDWAATAPPDREAIQDAQRQAFDIYANPSSIHPMGIRAEKLLADCRQSLAENLGCRSEELYFTSGGTESNNLVISSVLNLLQRHGTGGARAGGRRGSSQHSGGQRSDGRGVPRIIVSGIEHASVFASAGSLANWGVEVCTINTPPSGILDPESVAGRLNEHTRLVSIMLVNNETGAIQPIAAMAAIVSDYAKSTGRKILFHTDAVQAFGKLPFDWENLGVGALSVSSHKLGGPRGVGGLVIRKDRILQPIYRGGKQESGVRPGTENLPGICGFTRVAQRTSAHIEESSRKATQLMSRLIEELAGIDGVHIIPRQRVETPTSDYSPYILKISIPPVPAEVLVRALGQQGVNVSTGSACSSKSTDRTRVLDNMGIAGQLARSSLRISIGPRTTSNEIDRLLEIIRQEAPLLIQIAR